MGKVKITQAGNRHFEICTPELVADKLWFRAFDNAVPIAHARVEKLASRLANDSKTASGYSLKMIEVNQNYRQLGIGSAMLESIIDFCHEHKIPALQGEIRGDKALLSEWYANHGFLVRDGERIELPASAPDRHPHIQS